MQNVSSDFQNASESKRRRLAHNVKVAWDKTYDDTLIFATVGTSVIDGPDIIKGELDILTQPDFYEYTDESSQAVLLESTREITEPSGSTVYSFGSAIFSNANKRYDSEGSSSIKDYILPKRPVKMMMGFRIGGVDKTIPILYGISKAPSVDKKRAVFAMFDYLAYIQNYELNSDQMFVNQGSDEIIASILDQIGFDSTQYELDQGLNRVGFAYFPKGTRAGSVINELCEAEEGFFYQTEQGMIVFRNRIAYKEAPLNSPVMTIDESMIIELKDMGGTRIINSCKVSSKPRSVQDTTEIWSNGGIIQINPGDTVEVWAQLDDPAYYIEDMETTSLLIDELDIIGNSDPNGAGSDLTGDLNVTLTKFVQAAKIEIENTSGWVVNILKLRLRGNPAIVTSEIEATSNDTDSQEIYDVNVFEIRNNYIDNPDFAKYLSLKMVEKYASPKKRKQIKIRAIPQLQVLDMITLDYNGEEIDYRILKITLSMELGRFNQTLVIRQVTESESDQAAIVGISTIDGTDVIV